MGRCQIYMEYESRPIPRNGAHSRGRRSSGGPKRSARIQAAKPSANTKSTSQRCAPMKKVSQCKKGNTDQVLIKKSQRIPPRQNQSEKRRQNATRRCSVVEFWAR